MIWHAELYHFFKEISHYAEAQIAVIEQILL